jgi:hypothetical protein
VFFVAESSTTFLSPLWGPESTPGTPPGDANFKALRAISIENIKPTVEVGVERLLGQKIASVSWVGRESSELSLRGQPAYGQLAHLFCGLLKNVSPTQLTEGATTVGYSWTFTPDLNTEETPKTFTISLQPYVEGANSRRMYVPYALVNTLTIHIPAQGRAELNGSVIGRALQTGATVISNPPSVEVVPILGKHVSVYIDNAATSIGTTKQTRVVDVEISFENRWSPLFVLDAAQESFAVHLEQPVVARLKLLMEVDQQGLEGLTQLRNNTTRFIRVDARGPLLPNASSTYYLFRLDMAGVVQSIGELRDQDGLFAVEYTFESVWSTAFTTPKALTVTVQNTVQAL